MSAVGTPPSAQRQTFRFPLALESVRPVGVAPEVLCAWGLISPRELARARRTAPAAPCGPVPVAQGVVRWGAWQARETVAAVERYQAEHRAVEQLCRQVQAERGLCVRLSPTPWPYRAAFCFRVDYDQYEPGDFFRMWDALEEAAEWSSHFVNARAYENAHRAVAVLRGLHVGGHGYHHHTYRDPRQNRRNIARGMEVLDRLGLEPQGFAAPGGRFTPELPQVLEELGVEFSSEFQLAWDCWPFWPEGSGVLQVPIHPICLGSFLEAVQAGRDTAPSAEQTAARVAQAAKDYFCHLLRLRLEAGRWVILYGHPTGRLGRFPALVRAVLRQVQCTPGVWKTTMLQMARWWKFRCRLTWQARCHRWGLELEGPRTAGPWTPQLEIRRGGRTALVPLRPGRTRLGWEELAWFPQPQEEEEHPLLELRPLRSSWSGRLKQWLDWEKETPVAELPTAGVAALVKKTLRLLRR